MNAPAPGQGAPATFTTGSVMRHMIVLALTGSIGLMAIFFVDFLSLLYVSWLKDAALTAGVGYATTVFFIAISINVGMMIATGALVSRAIGAGDRTLAKRLAVSCLTLSTLASAAISLVMMPFLPAILSGIGASGTALTVAEHYLWITMPSNALMGLGMGLSGVLRAIGDPRRAMNVTVAGGLATALLDPLLIFGLGLGVTGAAIATVGSRLVFVIVGLRAMIGVHDFLRAPRLSELKADAGPMASIAGPAVLTNVATPIASVFIVQSLAGFGDAIIAGNTILDRVVPLAFGALFALSGAAGPIFGQNFGARRFDRLTIALRDALILAVGYVGAVWLVLLLARNHIGDLFGASGASAEYIAFFCLIAGVMWGFNGALFVANAAFNNLGMALLSTGFNWGRATLGTIPFALAGAKLGGPHGVLVGITLGSVIFGTAAVIVAFRQIRALERRHRAPASVVAAAHPT